MDDIQVLHMQNNAYRDLIEDLKRNINELDRKILANEREIGLQLEHMSINSRQPVETLYDCMLCMGSCANNTNLGEEK